jgi:chromatin segregation and condensation protein Rec8/ScpA/Scc1 (kleisin family)
LPEGDSEETISPERELKEMLIVYLTIKQAAHDLGERPLLYRDRFPRGSSQPERSLARTGLASLLQAIEAIKARTRHYIIKMEGRQFSIREMMARIHDMLKTREKIALREAATTGGKPELIALFMAALELSRSSIARLFQKGMFGRIYIISNR